jgi:UDP-2,3-diacylglucosamine hydrolase
MEPMAEEQRTIGVIAGNGIYPETFLKAARPHGVWLAVAAFKGETPDGLEGLADTVEWFRVGQLGKMIRYFRREGAGEAVMVGQIAPKNLYEFRPDLRTLAMIARLKERNAESLFGAVAEELRKDGIELLPATTFLEDCLPGPGPVCGPVLDRKALEDAEFGFRIAKETSRLDIGQSVIVRDGTVLAVEAFEGTNACIRRGGELGRGKNVKLIKVTKPRQDFRFDVPVVGPETIRACAEAGVGVVVVEAGCTLLLGAEEVRALCEEHRIALHALAGASP